MTLTSQPYAILFEQVGNQTVPITVCISLYNYARYIPEALTSVYQQSLAAIDLIIVDDASQDTSIAVTTAWLSQHNQRFNRILLLRHRQNSGLSATRNTAIAQVTSPLVFILDADNVIYPRCLAQCLEAIESSNAAFAYPLIEKFGSATGIMGNILWSRDRLAEKNDIDAMALIRRSALAAVAGYTHMPWGWEDYDLWCKFAERGEFGVLVPEILARYRVHPKSMLHTTTHQQRNLHRLIVDMKQRHPWLHLKPS
ncbi:MAG: glycosyltransferase [Elainella sp. Prado103]|jgi:glycosyltransferase involved in cell wall biosynthesis|nr:glycosyltransferase [Elainella sp. Prado103]